MFNMHEEKKRNTSNIFLRENKNNNVINKYIYITVDVDYVHYAASLHSFPSALTSCKFSFLVFIMNGTKMMHLTSQRSYLHHFPYPPATINYFVQR